MRLIGLTGAAGSGKSTVASILARDHAEVAFADVMKRFVCDVFNWSPESLWGPSELRGRAPNPRCPEVTPRRVLQTLGTEWGRSLHEDIWLDYTMRVVDNIVGGAWYTPRGGLDWGVSRTIRGIVISDVRFPNEARAIRARGGQIWRCARSGAGSIGAADTHASEAGIPDDLIDAQLDNNGTFEALAAQIQGLLVGR